MLSPQARSETFETPLSAREGAALRARIAALEELLDVQERTVLEQAQRLERHSEALRRSNAALEQFAYVISHDLQEPLRMISAYTELLGEAYRGRLDAKADTYIGYASGGARRMQELINALLDFSRITSRQRELEELDLDSVVDAALQNLEVRVQETHAVIRRGPLPRLRGDRIQLVQLVQNLIANALKFTRDGVVPEVDIGGSVDGDHAVFHVKDNGIGVAPRYHARIFSIFQRLQPKRFPGTGIGLAVCKRIAERHDGSIVVDSAADQGSTFIVRIPRTEVP